MLTCKSKLEILSKIKTMDADGTFEYCKNFLPIIYNSRPFQQFIIIYYMLLIYFFVTNRQLQWITYIEVLKVIDLEF